MSLSGVVCRLRDENEALTCELDETLQRTRGLEKMLERSSEQESGLQERISALEEQVSGLQERISALEVERALCSTHLPGVPDARLADKQSRNLQPRQQLGPISDDQFQADTIENGSTILDNGSVIGDYFKSGEVITLPPVSHNSEGKPYPMLPQMPSQCVNECSATDGTAPAHAGVKTSAQFFDIAAENHDDFVQSYEALDKWTDGPTLTSMSCECFEARWMELAGENELTTALEQQHRDLQAENVRLRQELADENELTTALEHQHRLAQDQTHALEARSAWLQEMLSEAKSKSDCTQDMHLHTPLLGNPCLGPCNGMSALELQQKLVSAQAALEAQHVELTAANSQLAQELLRQREDSSRTISVLDAQTQELEKRLREAEQHATVLARENAHLLGATDVAADVGTNSEETEEKRDEVVTELQTGDEALEIDEAW